MKLASVRTRELAGSITMLCVVSDVIISCVAGVIIISWVVSVVIISCLVSDVIISLVTSSSRVLGSSSSRVSVSSPGMNQSSEITENV